LLKQHPVIAYFTLAYAISWAVELPLVASARGASGTWRVGLGWVLFAVLSPIALFEIAAIVGHATTSNALTFRMKRNKPLEPPGLPFPRPVGSRSRSPLKFFSLVFTLSIPFWLLGAVTGRQLLPSLPVSSLMAFCPLMAAAILVYHENGFASVVALLKRTFDFKRVTAKIWYVPTLLLMPGIMATSYIVMRLMGVPLPAPQFLFATALILFVVFFIAGVGEELGWSGYAIDPLQDRLGALGGTLLLGVVWGVWHFIPLLEVQRAPVFIAWWSLGTLASRVIITWLYNNTGKSVFVAVLFHTMIDLTWQLFPINGSYYDPRVTSLILTFVAAIVTLAWGPRTLAHRLAVGLGALGLVVAVVLPIMLPVFRFPHPSGPYAIGTLTYHWVGADRPEVFSVNPKDRRELMVQLWYPAKGDSSSPRAPYVQGANALASALAGLKNFPAFIFGQLKYVTTNAIPSAPVADDKPNYPVLIFLEGAIGFRQMNTFQVEELVSHGYIVAAIDQPYTAASVVFPDGHQVTGLSLDKMMPLIHQSYSPAEKAPTLNGQTFEKDIVPYLAQDVTFTLNQLAALNQADPNAILTGRLNLQQVGTFGVSLGGIVGSEACRLEPRLRACLVMDAPMPAAVIQSGLQQPTMWITRDAETMRLERRRSGGWSEVDIYETQTSMRGAFENLRGEGYFVQIPNMFHVNLTDIPYWSPLLPWLGVTGPIDGQRAYNIINAYTLAFFDRHLKGRPVALLDGPAEQYPEVIFEKRRPNLPRQ